MKTEYVNKVERDAQIIELLEKKEPKRKRVVGRAGFQPATARFLWPMQARIKPTVGRLLQRLRGLCALASSRALPG